MVFKSEKSTLVTSIVARSLGVFYGILSLLNFKSAENLNLWILSGYVATVVTLANIIVQPSELKYRKIGVSYIYIFGKPLSRIIFKRVVLAFMFQIFLSIAVVVSSDLKASATYIIGIFLFQSLQYPFLFRILSRNEINYFRHSRIYLLRASFVGNAISLLTILVFYFLDTFIDSTLETFTIFITLQIFSLAVQDIMYTLETKSAKLIHHKQSEYLKSEEQFYIRKILPGLRTYIYVPCLASFWLFIHEPLNPEITSVFLGLNLVTLLTYLGLPNDKLEYVVDNKEKLKKSLQKIIKRSIVLCLLLLSSMFVTLYIANQNNYTSVIINSQNIISVSVLSFIGLFLLPVVLLSNNQNRDYRSKFGVLDATILTLITSFAILLFLTKLSATACIAFSYASSFLVWYTITFWNIRGKASSESSR